LKLYFLVDEIFSGRQNILRLTKYSLVDKNSPVDKIFSSWQNMFRLIWRRLSDGRKGGKEWGDRNRGGRLRGERG
jgi:hypothetical protein